MDYVLTLLSFGSEGWGDQILQGMALTIALALATLPLGLLQGFLLALAKHSNDPNLNRAADIYTTIFRGLPELMTLFLVYYGVQIGLQSLIGLFHEDFYFEINSFVAGMVALGVVFSSYASEVFLSAFKGIPQGQYEGGHALGLSNYQTMRLIIFPQLIRLALPGLSNLWLVLLKDTALVSVIGLSDLLRMSGIAARVSKEPFLFYGLACALYLALSLISSVGLVRIESWARRGEAKR
ncbi:ABC transporter permease [Breoghania sp.]|uniref:ABC transporter permease n=1 Tax=Breoghania sp. TaxID=2065378 RepID=UPI002AAB2353|nr:ABC transporter permease [Breoghania sp.]